MLIGAFSKAFEQLGDPRTRKVFWIGILVAAAVFAVLWAGLFYLLATTSLAESGWLSWADWLIDILGGAAALWLSWILFPAVITLVVGLLLEYVADAVEARHYPDVPEAPGQRVGEAILSALRFACVIVLLNLFMLVFLLFPPLFLFVFYAVNGYLLGREYFELVAMRRLTPAETRVMRRRHGGAVVTAGVIIAFLLTVPIVNLLTPVVATAAMVHLFESWRRRDAATA